jgi:hypothetical protein
MKKLFNINNSEKERILEMHINATKNQYLNEQEASVKQFKASTDNMKMYNFPSKQAKSSNSQYGLQGDSKLENYYFTSTIGDIANQSKLDSSEYLKNFKPANDAKTYVDFISVGGKEINGGGTETFDVNKNSKIIATHNGLLAIKRVMDQMKNINYKGEPAKMTITMAGEERSSEFKTYDPNAAKKLYPTANSIIKHFATLIVPTEYRKSITDMVVDRIKLKPTTEIQNYIKLIVDSSLVTQFLPDQKEWKTVKEQLKLKGSESTELRPIFEKSEYGRERGALNQSLWENFWKSFKQAYLYNYSQYVTNKYPENAQKLIKDLSESIKNQDATSTLQEAFNSLFKNKEYGTTQSVANTGKQGKQTYGTGQ